MTILGESVKSEPKSIFRLPESPARIEASALRSTAAPPPPSSVRRDDSIRRRRQTSAFSALTQCWQCVAPGSQPGSVTAKEISQLKWQRRRRRRQIGRCLARAAVEKRRRAVETSSREAEAQRMMAERLIGFRRLCAARRSEEPQPKPKPALRAKPKPRRGGRLQQRHRTAAEAPSATCLFVGARAPISQVQFSSA